MPRISRRTMRTRPPAHFHFADHDFGFCLYILEAIERDTIYWSRFIASIDAILTPVYPEHNLCRRNSHASALHFRYTIRAIVSAFHRSR